MKAEQPKTLGALLFVLLLVVSISASVHPVLAYAPQPGDSFNYSETIAVNSGQGSYSGYSDQTLVTGTESMNSVSAGLVSASFDLSYQYTGSTGNSSSSNSGQYTWSSGNFTYVSGTDNQVGYSRPIYVWFAMNPSLPIGATFHALNTQFTVMSKNYSFLLPTEGDKYVQAIQAVGSGSYQRDDSYGVFNATYTWNEYFDPTTGYIVGYNYVEQDSGQYQGAAGSFTYTDDLYVTSTSYALAQAAPTTSTTSGEGLLGSAPYLVYALALLAVMIVIAVVVYAATRRRGKGATLPKHSEYVPQPPPTPSESKIDLGSRPPEQVVIREVAKVNCKYCGTLIPTTADTCPYCGAPRK